MILRFRLPIASSLPSLPQGLALESPLSFHYQRSADVRAQRFAKPLGFASLESSIRELAHTIELLKVRIVECGAVC